MAGLFHGPAALRRMARFLAGLALCLAVIYAFFRYSPYPGLKTFLGRPYSLRFFDRNGFIVQINALEDGLRREYRPLGEIKREASAVFVHAEDSRFYRHWGIDIAAVARAFYQNISSGRRVSGASTITMQLARLIESEKPRRGPIEKIKEAFNALRLEARFSKDEILELYLNSIPFGFQTEGIVSAARNFFSVETEMLTPAQIFCLAVIPRRPSANNPIFEKDACAAAATALHSRFAENKALSAEFPLLASIQDEDWRFALDHARRYEYPYEMPHFIRYVNGKLENAISAKHIGKYAKTGGITLSADLPLQHYLEGLLAANISRYYTSRLTNGAVIVIDNDTGEILAWAGSADYHNTEAAGQIDGILTLNQSGSSMKPFLYAMALEKGFAPTDVLADIPVNFGTHELYIPHNFNNRFNGPMLLRSALASSLNIPAVTLLYRLGIRNYVDFLLSLGMDSIEGAEESAGLGLALGNAPVSVAELVRAFSVFPNDGFLIPLSFEKVSRDTGETGNAAAKKTAAKKTGTREAAARVISSDTARVISSFLSDRSARVLAFGFAANFNTPFPAMFKTGTANQYQSITALGATPRFSAAVWMGNFTGETVIGKTGSSIPLAIVRDALIFLQGKSGGAFREPDAYVKIPVCSLSGMAPGAACPSAVTEYVRRETPQGECSWHSSENGHIRVSYPGEYQNWFFALARDGELNYGGLPLTIVTPRDNFVFLNSPATGRNGIPVEVIGGSHDELLVEYGGETFTVSRPFNFYLPLVPGEHTLTVHNRDESESVSFSVNVIGN